MGEALVEFIVFVGHFFGGPKCLADKRINMQINLHIWGPLFSLAACHNTLVMFFCRNGEHKVSAPNRASCVCIPNLQGPLKPLMCIRDN